MVVKLAVAVLMRTSATENSPEVVEVPEGVRREHKVPDRKREQVDKHPSDIDEFP